MSAVFDLFQIGILLNVKSISYKIKILSLTLNYYDFKKIEDKRGVDMNNVYVTSKICFRSFRNSKNLRDNNFISWNITTWQRFNYKEVMTVLRDTVDVLA